MQNLKHLKCKLLYFNWLWYAPILLILIVFLSYLYSDGGLLIFCLSFSQLLLQCFVELNHKA